MSRKNNNLCYNNKKEKYITFYVIFKQKMTLNQKIGNNLKNARLEKGLTQKEVAEKMGILQPAYARFESGRFQLSYEQVQELCKILEITPDILWGYQEL